MPQYNDFRTVPKIAIDDKDTLSLVYTPGVGSSCLKIAENPDAALVYTNKINSVAVIAFDYEKALKRTIFLKSVLLIDAYPLVVDIQIPKEDLKFAIENIDINFCAIDLSLMEDFVKDIEIDVEIPVLKEPVSNLKDFFGAISRNVFMIDPSKLKGNIQERSLQLHELSGGVIETELTEQKRNKPVAIVSDGTAVLGYGNIGALASIPVMEGKAALYSELADVDSMVFCIKSQKSEDVIKIVRIFADSFCGIHLEDISAPSCFEIENALSQSLNIPVFHDDQHGTAIIVLAGLLNALVLEDKKISDIKIVIAGAGAAGTAVAKLLLFAGAKNIIMDDINGTVYKGRESNDKYLEELASMTNPDNERGELKDIIKNADVFIGLSKGGLLTEEMVQSMEYRPIVFALANPEPEIMPDAAKHAGVYIMSTGRSDFENQINNALAFPGLFKGLIDGKIKKVTNEIKLESALMIASMVPTDELTPDNILPDALDRMLPLQIAKTIEEKFSK